MRAWLLYLLLAAALPGQSQQRKKKEAGAAPVEAFFPQQEYGPKVSGRRFLGMGRRAQQGPTRTATARYEAREALLAKRARKRELRGPDVRFADPRYFGHKRLPRRRALEKMKYCKVCGIRH